MEIFSHSCIHRNFTRMACLIDTTTLFMMNFYQNVLFIECLTLEPFGKEGNDSISSFLRGFQVLIYYNCKWKFRKIMLGSFSLVNQTFFFREVFLWKFEILNIYCIFRWLRVLLYYFFKTDLPSLSLPTLKLLFATSFYSWRTLALQHCFIGTKTNHMFFVCSGVRRPRLPLLSLWNKRNGAHNRGPLWSKRWRFQVL